MHFKNLIKGMAHRTRAELIRRFGQTDYQPYILLSRSRTGSNLLLSYLNSHPHISGKGEVFARLDGHHWKDILERQFCKRSHHIRAHGFKIFYYHPMDQECPELWQALFNMNELVVIHLKRRNILRTLVSRKIAGRLDQWQSTEGGGTGSSKDKRVHFTVEELQDGFTQTRSWENTFESRFANHRTIEIFYEDLVAEPAVELGKVTKELGLPGFAARTELQRQNPESLRQLVVNYDELKSAFNNSDWISFFSD